MQPKYRLQNASNSTKMLECDISLKNFFLIFLPDANLTTKIQDTSGKNMAYGNPILLETVTLVTQYSTCDPNNDDSIN